MIKKILCRCCIAIMCVAMLACGTSVFAASVTQNDIISAAADIIQQNEGAYSSVNRDDNGALSVGWLQWHGNRALSLLKSICSANASQAKSKLGTTLYNEVTTASSWSARVLTSDEATKISALISTKEGMDEQDKLALSDISTYVNHGMTLGITDPAALVYFADLENQCGGGGSARVAGSAATLAGGSYSAININSIHNAALADSVAGKYDTRRNKVYNYCIILGWSSSTLSYSYEVWTINTTLYVRESAGTSAKPISTFYTGTSVVITSKYYTEGMTWGKCYMGWISLDYADYASGSIPTPVKYEMNGGTFTTKAASTRTVDGLNSARAANNLIVYDGRNSTANTVTNIYGGEAVVDQSGKVTKFGGYGSCKTAIPTNGLVLSGIGTGYSWLYSYAKEGYYIYFDESEMTVTAYPSVEAYSAAHKLVKYASAYGTLPTPEKTGCIFDGWYVSYTDNAANAENSKMWARRTMTLYARWREAAASSVVYVTEGGTIDGTFQKSFDGVNQLRAADQLVIYNSGASTGTNIYGSEVAVSSDGIVIKKYQYGVGNAEIPAGGFVISGNGTMSAWVIENLALGNYVTYDSTAKTMTVYDSETVFKSINKTLPAGTPLGTLPTATRQYYSFDGWYTTAGDKVSETTKIGEDGLVLHAHWTLIPGKVTFNANGGTLQSSPLTATVNGTNIGRPANGLVVYKDKSTTGTNIYGTEAAVDKSGNVICVYPYGAGNSSIPAGGYVLSGNGTMSSWISANVNVGDYVTVSGTKINVWKTVGNAQAVGKTLTYGGTFGILPTPEKSGYTFLGWYNSANEKITEATGVSFYGDITLTAKWQKNIAVTFNANGGKLTGASAVATANGYNVQRTSNTLIVYQGVASTGTNIYGAEAVVSADGTVTSFTSYGTGNTKVPSGGFVLSGNGTGSDWLKANVKVGSFIVKKGFAITAYNSAAEYNAAAGTFTFPESAEIGTLPTASMSKASFVAWTDSAGNTVSAKTVLSGTAQTLKAKWTKNTGTLSYELSGGSFAAPETAVAAGTNIGRAANELVIYKDKATTGTNIYGVEAAVAADGSVLCVYPYGTGNSIIPTGGFTVSANGSMCSWINENISAGCAVKISGNTVYVYKSQGDMLATAKTVSYGGVFGILPTPEKSGYVFTGWLNKGSPVNESTAVTDCDNLSLTATWAKAVKVSFNAGKGTVSGLLATVKANGMNTARGSGSIIIYQGVSTTGANAYGTEAFVGADKTVTSVIYGKSNSAIPSGGFIISGNGAGGSWVSANIKAGYYIDITGVTINIYESRAAYLAANGGITLAAGAAAGALPTAVEKYNDFTGWYSDAACTAAFGETSKAPSADFTLYAGWTPKKENISFDTAGGSLPSAVKAAANAIDSPRTKDTLIIYKNCVTTGTNIYGREAVVGANGFVSAINGNGGGTENNSTVPAGGFVLSGNGEMSVWLNTNVSVGSYVALDGLNVSVYDSRELYLIERDGSIGFDYGSEITYLPVPVRTGYSFSGWLDASGKAVSVGSTVTEIGSVKLVASWTKITATLIFEPDGGSFASHYETLAAGTNIQRLADTVVIYSGKASTGTNIYGAEAAVSADGTVKSVSSYGVGNTAIPSGGMVISGVGTMRTWVANNIAVGSYVETTGNLISVYKTKADRDIAKKGSVSVDFGSALGALPVPTKSGCTFDGWTANGTAVTAETVSEWSGIVLLTAKWKAN